MRRGFKKEANEIAIEVRGELGLSDHNPLDPWRLARLLEIPVMPLSEFANSSEYCFHHFTVVETEAFSAVTVFDGNKRIIVHNDLHSRPRQVSNLTHEAAHGLLHHTPSPALDANGCRNWDDEIEKEAEYLAGALLVTESAALFFARRKIPLHIAARQLGISTSMVSYRLNVTGALKRTQRSFRKRHRTVS